jgi:hypothetical protein
MGEANGRRGRQRGRGPRHAGPGARTRRWAAAGGGAAPHLRFRLGRRRRRCSRRLARATALVTAARAGRGPRRGPLGRRARAPALPAGRRQAGHARRCRLPRHLARRGRLAAGAVGARRVARGGDGPHAAGRRDRGSAARLARGPALRAGAGRRGLRRRRVGDLRPGLRRGCRRPPGRDRCRPRGRGGFDAGRPGGRRRPGAPSGPPRPRARAPRRRRRHRRRGAGRRRPGHRGLPRAQPLDRRALVGRRGGRGRPPLRRPAHGHRRARAGPRGAHDPGPPVGRPRRRLARAAARRRRAAARAGRCVAGAAGRPAAGPAARAHGRGERPRRRGTGSWAPSRSTSTPRWPRRAGAWARWSRGSRAGSSTVGRRDSRTAATGGREPAGNAFGRVRPR